ncbi:hypothetical protein [Streptomyces atratus]|uniref:hypothetical protein n=1 Tax=Streptomyces atratus TaxID=1893 RepID=UPI003F53FF5F
MLIANVPHPLEPRPDYTCTPLEVQAWRARPTTPGDPARDATSEGNRAFLGFSQGGAKSHDEATGEL